MRIITCDQSWQGAWDDFVTKNATDSGMFQSWRWGNLLTQEGNQVLRLAITDDSDDILLVAQVVVRALGFGKKYFYIPRGPIIACTSELILFPQLQQHRESLELLFTELKRQAKKHHAIFLRYDPPWDADEATNKILRSWKFLYSGEVQPQETLVIDLGCGEEKLLEAMKPKTRYNIKVAQKHGVEIDEGKHYFDDFWSLTTKTAARNKITVHGQAHYHQLVDWLYATKSGNLMIAKYQGEVIVANINLYYNNWWTYLHGASDYEHHNKMAPYLLQWRAICLAQQRGYAKYDLWGINESKWPGVTRFKQGFASAQAPIRYIGSWDTKYSRFWYMAYNFMRRFK